MEKSYYFVTLGIAVDYLIGLSEEEALKIMTIGGGVEQEEKEGLGKIEKDLEVEGREKKEEIEKIEGKTLLAKEKIEERGLLMNAKEGRGGAEEGGKEGEITEEGEATGGDYREREKEGGNEEEQMKMKEEEGELNETRKLEWIVEEKYWKQEKGGEDFFGRKITLEKMA